MKKVMLVDDEIVIRENIRDCVDWEKEGFVYCGDAADGEVALPLIEKWLPDILITDIKMPFMNGLELSTIVRKRWPRTKIVILSGHDEFSYARSALQIGVEEYCLKPVRSLDLIRLLRSVGDKIDEERRTQDRRAYTRDKLFGDLCGGLVSVPDAIEASTGLGINLIASAYAALICDVRDVKQPAYADAASVARAERIVDEQLSEVLDGWRFKRSRTETVWIVREDSIETLDKKLCRIRDALLPRLENELPCPIVFGIGSAQDRLQGIHVSFLEAEEDRNLRRLSLVNRNELWHFASRAENSTVYLDRGQFMEFLKIGSPQQAPAFVRRFTASLREINWKSTPYGYYLLYELLLESLQEAKKAFRASEIPQSAVMAWQAEIRNIAGWPEACAFLEQLLEKLWEWRSGAAGRYGEMIARAKSYIEREYANDRLSLQDAAEYVNVSPSHLSKVFSQETGQTFIEYLTRTRIRGAMVLLKTTNCKSYEIAFRVGYNDAHYFSNLFKKMTGMTTREFRRQGRLPDFSAEGKRDENTGELA